MYEPNKYHEDLESTLVSWILVLEEETSDFGISDDEKQRTR